MRLPPVNKLGVYSLTKIRIYELAKEIGVSTKELMDKLDELNIKVGSHMSSVDKEEAELLKDFIKEEKEETGKKDELIEDFADDIVEEIYEKKASPSKPKKNKKHEDREKTNLRKEKEKKELNNKENKIIEVDNRIIVKDLAEKMGVSSSQVISKLIALGVMAGINQEIDFDAASIVAS